MYILTKFLKSLLHPHPLCRQCDHHLDLARDDNDNDHNTYMSVLTAEREAKDGEELIDFIPFWILLNTWGILDPVWTLFETPFWIRCICFEPSVQGQGGFGGRKSGREAEDGGELGREQDECYS